MLIYTASPARCLERLLEKRAWRQRWLQRHSAQALQPVPSKVCETTAAACSPRQPPAWTSRPRPLRGRLSPWQRRAGMQEPSQHIRP